MTEKNFEKSIERLEAVVSRMESGELTLDEALAHYEEGIKLSRFCYQKLTEAEKKIINRTMFCNFTSMQRILQAKKSLYVQSDQMSQKCKNHFSSMI